MNVEFQPIAKQQALDMIGDLPIINYSNPIWSWSVDNQYIAMVGLVIPTMISERAYIWLHHSDIMVYDHRVLFMRRSKRFIADLLDRYEFLEGHADPAADDSIRFLRWLGAEIGDPEGGLVRFEIRRTHDHR